MPANNSTTPEQNAPTRFTLMVENVFEVDENVSIAAVGNLHGKIRRGDSFYILHPTFPQGLKATAETLVVGEDTPDEAENCRLAIKMTDISDPKRIPKFSVITNVPPQVRPDPSVPTENPYVVGLSTEYNKFVKDHDFTYAFMAALLTSRYLTPAVVRQGEPATEGGASTTKVSFKLLKHPNNTELHVLPLFTDNAALSLWKGIFDQEEPDGEKAKRLLLPFERCAEVALANDGLVINPFGPAAVFVSKENVQNTVNLGKQVLQRQKELEEKQKAEQ